MGYTYYFQNPDDPEKTGWNPYSSPDLVRGYEDSKCWEKASQKIVAAEPSDLDWRVRTGKIVDIIKAIRKGERPGAFFLKEGQWYISCPETAHLWELGSAVNAAPSMPGPRKPPPVLPVEVWNVKPIDPVVAWKAMQDLCKGI